MRALKILLLFFLLFSNNIYAQNLVINPSFEDIDTTILKCGYYQSAEAFNNVMKSSWINPSEGTSDVISLYVKSNCSTFAFPNKSADGEQMPRTGKAMGAIVTAHNYGEWEYIQNRIAAPMVLGQKYHFSMYVSLADLICYGSNIGIYFSNIPIAIEPAYWGQYNLAFVPQIEFDTVVLDTKNWVKLEADIIATQPWQYITIGNFRTKETQNLSVNPESKCNFMSISGAYYFIDDVSVVAVCEKKKDEVVDLYYGKSVNLKAPENYYKLGGWANASNPTNILSTEPSLLVSPIVPSTYLFYYNSCDTLAYNVSMQCDLHVNLGNVKGLYKPNPIMLDATNENANYLWQDQSSQSQYLVKQSGTYWVTVSDIYGCEVSDTVIIVDVILEMPNVFTPTNDNVNDHFAPIAISGIKSAELSVYNRWGAIVYKTNNLKQGWDGNNTPEGVYYWYINYTDVNNVTSSQKGDVTLIR